MLKKIIKKLWYTLFNDSPYIYLGRFIVAILPKSYVSRFYCNEFFSSSNAPRGIITNIVRREINRKYYSKQDDEIRRLNRERFWGAKAGKRWHELTRRVYEDGHEFEEKFLKFRKPLVKHILDLRSIHPEFNTICEIGTGTGMFLEYLSRQLADINDFIGVDLNKEQIVENQQIYAYSNPRLKFIFSEITDYINELYGKSRDHIIFVACGGVLEYFTQTELKELFQLIQYKVKHTAIAISEPTNLDLKKEFISRPRGDIAYSHNYPHLMKQCGYHIFRKEVLPVGADLFVIMVGVNFTNC